MNLYVQTLVSWKIINNTQNIYKSIEIMIRKCFADKRGTLHCALSTYPPCARVDSVCTVDAQLNATNTTASSATAICSILGQIMVCAELCCWAYEPRPFYSSQRTCAVSTFYQDKQPQSEQRRHDCTCYQVRIHAK